MKRSDSSVALSILVDMPLSGISTRQSMSAFDYGDEKTVLKCVKRKGCDIFGGDYNNKFGLFLGLHEGVYVIGVSNLGEPANFNATETFETQEEMKHHWILD
jgi:hypothetical protein